MLVSLFETLHVTVSKKSPFIILSGGGKSKWEPLAEPLLVVWWLPRALSVAARAQGG